MKKKHGVATNEKLCRHLLTSAHVDATWHTFQFRSVILLTDITSVPHGLPTRLRYAKAPGAAGCIKCNALAAQSTRRWASAANNTMSAGEVLATLSRAGQTNVSRCQETSEAAELPVLCPDGVRLLHEVVRRGSGAALWTAECSPLSVGR
jgi:hypothetical protein